MRCALRDRLSLAVAGLLTTCLAAAAPLSASPAEGPAPSDAAWGEPLERALAGVDLLAARAAARRRETAEGDLAVVAAAGSRDGYALRARYHGGGRNGYSRLKVPVRWEPGDEVRYGAWYFLPHGFTDAIQGEVDLVRFDNFPLDPQNNDRSGVVIYERDRRARLVRQRLGREQAVLGRPFDLPEGRWFHLEVRQRLGRRDARSTVLIDGEPVLFSRARTSYGRPVQRIRFGLVAVASGAQRQGLTVYLDAPFWGVDPQA